MSDFLVVIKKYFITLETQMTRYNLFQTRITEDKGRDILANVVPFDY